VDLDCLRLDFEVFFATTVWMRDFGFELDHDRRRVSFTSCSALLQYPSQNDNVGSGLILELFAADFFCALHAFPHIVRVQGLQHSRNQVAYFGGAFLDRHCVGLNETREKARIMNTRNSEKQYNVKHHYPTTREYYCLSAIPPKGRIREAAVRRRPM
jgi:hypothetical protein